MTRLYRKGDIVSIRGTVFGDQTEAYDDGAISVQILNGWDRLYVPISSVELIIPYFNVGDPVSNGQSTGKVMAKDGNALWVRLDDTRSFETWSAVDTDLAETGGAQ